MLIQQTSLNINQQNRISFKENPNQSRYSQLHEDMERIAKITEPDIIKVKEPKKQTFIKNIKTIYKKAKKEYKAILIGSLALLSFTCGYLVKPIFIRAERNKFEELRNSKQSMLDEYRNDSIRLDSINNQLTKQNKQLEETSTQLDETIKEKKAEIKSLDNELTNKRVNAVDNDTREPLTLYISPNRTFTLYPNGKLKKETVTQKDNNGIPILLYEAEYAPDGHKIKEYSELSASSEKPDKTISEFFDDGTLKYKKIERYWKSGKSRYVAYEVKYRSPGVKEMELKTHRDKKDKVVQEIYTFDKSGSYADKTTRTL